MVLPSITEMGLALRTGQTTAQALVESHLATISRHNGRLSAFVHVDEDRALNAARRADAELASGLDRGPLHGMPIALKDLVDVAGMPCQYGSAGYLGRVPEADAAIVGRLREAGAIILGKLTTYEFATVGPSFDTPFPPAVNPWNTDHITGGSSSGSAAAVAGGLLRIAIGTDTGGSVRSPASYCGVVGLKPTYGRVSKDGVLPLSPSLDHVGPIACSVAEAALVLDAISEPGSWLSASAAIGQSIDGMEIGYARAFFVRDPLVSPAIVDAIDAAASTLTMLGAKVSEIDLPPYEHFEAAAAAILHAESFALHAERLASRRQTYGTKTFRTLAAGAAIGSHDVALARAVGKHLQTRLNREVFSRFSAIILPTTLSSAPEVSSFKGDAAVWTPMRTMGFNLTGHPALSVACGFHEGLPLGLQIVGASGGEASICQIGHAFETSTDFSSVVAPGGTGNDLRAVQ